MSFLFAINILFLICLFIYCRIYCFAFYDFSKYLLQHKNHLDLFTSLKSENFVDQIQTGDIIIIKNKPYISNIINYYLADYFNHCMVVFKENKQIFALDISFGKPLLQIKTLEQAISQHSNMIVVVRFAGETSQTKNQLLKISQRCQQYNFLPFLLTQFSGFYNCLDVCKEYLVQRNILDSEWLIKEINFSDIIFEKIPMKQRIIQRYIFFPNN